MARLAVLALCAALLPGCKSGNSQPPTPPDKTPPRIVSAMPADGAIDVPVYPVIQIVFSEPLDCPTATGAFTLRSSRGTTLIPSVGCGESTVSLATPQLGYSTLYDLHVAWSIKDLAGNALGTPEPDFWFTTAAAPDTTPPTLIDTTPVGVAPATAIVQATFSEPIRCATINATTFWVTDGVNLVPGTLTCAGAIVTFTPAAPLAPGTTYNAVIGGGVQDLAGNLFPGGFWVFNVRLPVLMTQILEPAEGATGVASSTRIYVLFSDQMDAATFAASTFYVEDPDGARPALTFDVSGNSATATPAGRLEAATMYTVHLTAGIKAFDGTPLTPPSTWTFTTGPPGIGTWAPTSVAGAPAARSGHTAVWTGTKMLVWGGVGTTKFNDGALYDPATDTWSAISTAGAPTGRTAHVAVWTGSELIVWGGYDTAGWVNTGGRYDPAADRWTALPLTNAPRARVGAAAVWTGSKLLVWGGYGAAGYLDTGGSLDLAGGWSALPIGPIGRTRHSAVWTGSEMLIWGGDGDGAFIPDGVCYTPGVGWDAMDTTQQPIFRNGQSVVWTGSEMIVWGGANWSGAISSGGRYSPVTGWTLLPEADAPYPRSDAPAVWTGSAMIVWGVYYGTGGRYSPATDAWTATAEEGAPSGRSGHSAVWTGKELIVWGGYLPDGAGATNTGGRYSP